MGGDAGGRGRPGPHGRHLLGLPAPGRAPLQLSHVWSGRPGKAATPSELRCPHLCGQASWEVVRIQWCVAWAEVTRRGTADLVVPRRTGPPTPPHLGGHTSASPEWNPCNDTGTVSIVGRFHPSSRWELSGRPHLGRCRDSRQAQPLTSGWISHVGWGRGNGSGGRHRCHASAWPWAGAMQMQRVLTGGSVTSIGRDEDTFPPSAPALLRAETVPTALERSAF